MSSSSRWQGGVASEVAAGRGCSLSYLRWMIIGAGCGDRGDGPVGKTTSGGAALGSTQLRKTYSEGIVT